MLMFVLQYKIPIFHFQTFDLIPLQIYEQSEEVFHSTFSVTFSFFPIFPFQLISQRRDNFLQLIPVSFCPYQFCLARCQNKLMPLPQPKRKY